jgi:hypothetical protein
MKKKEKERKKMNKDMKILKGRKEPQKEIPVIS